MFKLIKRRIKEPTTWLGLSIIASIAGVPPDVIAAGTKFIAVLAASAGVALPENTN